MRPSYEIRTIAQLLLTIAKAQEEWATAQAVKDEAEIARLTPLVGDLLDELPKDIRDNVLAVCGVEPSYWSWEP